MNSILSYEVAVSKYIGAELMRRCEHDVLGFYCYKCGSDTCYGGCL